MDPVTKDHELVKSKVAAGLTLDDAIEVTKRQLAQDEAVEAETKAAKKKKDKDKE